MGSSIGHRDVHTRSAQMSDMHSGVGDSWPPNCTRFGRGDSVSGENPGVLSPASPWRLPIQKPPCPTLSSSVPQRPVTAEILFRTLKGPQPARSGLSIHSLHLNFNLSCSVFYLRISRSGRVMGPIKGVGPRNPRPPSQHLSPFLLLCCFSGNSGRHGPTASSLPEPYGILKSPYPAALTLALTS